MREQKAQEVKTMNMIFPFTSTGFPTVDQVDGKALALMAMTESGMPVPPGFVLAAKFFEPWTVLLQASSAWEAVQKAEADELGRTIQVLQSLCRDLEFSPQQQQELDEALASFHASYGETLFAVRSSSPEEDLEEASFAGGYETTLGVTAETMNAAILHSFASSLSERVLVYKKVHGFSIDQPCIAIIVQQQVDADSAGVAFSLNPLNNCYDEVVINANYGLGESVVAGEVEPDVFVVDKIERKIIDTQIGGKEIVIALKSDGGTTRASRRRDGQPCITPAQALELTALLKKVEDWYQKPVDIEWAISGGKIFLLQARPITTYLPLPPQMLTAPGEPKRLYANSTLIEQGLQEPLSVLGTDFLSYVLNNVGGPVAEGMVGPGGITFTAGGGYYMNISYAHMMGMKAARLAPGSVGDPRVQETLAGIDMRQYTGGELSARLKKMRGKMIFKMLPMVGSVLRAYFRPEHILAKYQAALPEEDKRLNTFSGAGLSLQEQAVALTGLLRFFYGEYGIPMVLTGQIAQMRIKGLFKQEAAQV
jgi:pyruvate,water dikinase